MLLTAYLLCFLSPVLGLGLAVMAYARHRKRLRDTQRPFPVLVYALALLVFAAGGYVLGLSFGIQWACAPPAGNLCGLTGVFIAGPLAAAFGMVMVGGLLSLAGRRADPL